MTYLVRRLTIASGSMGLAGLLFQPLMAQGQTTPAPPAATAAPAAPADPAISDRVKKDAASPLYWIRLNAQKTDAAAAPKPAPRIVEVKPVAAAPRPAPAPAAAPVAAAAPVSTGTVAATGAGAPVVPAATNPAVAAGGANTDVGRSITAAATAHPPAAAPTTSATAARSAPPAPATGAAAAGLAAGAGMAAPSGASAAADAARTATAPVEEPDDSPLELVKADEPEFPITTMRRLRKGSVQVRFDVLPDGSVGNATIVTTSHRSLNEAALEAVASWRFQPVRSQRSAVVDLGFDLDS